MKDTLEMSTQFDGQAPVRIMPTKFITVTCYAACDYLLLFESCIMRNHVATARAACRHNLDPTRPVETIHVGMHDKHADAQTSSEAFE